MIVTARRTNGSSGVRLHAVEGIKAWKARQQRGVDTNDRDLLLRAFSDDVVADTRGIATDPSSAINLYPDSDLVFHGIATHRVSTPQIEVTSPTTGTAIRPQVDRLRFKDGAPYKEVIGYGFHHETYERGANDWRIKTMRMVRIMVEVIPR